MRLLGREENVVEAGGLKSQGIIFFLFPFSVPCIMPFGRFDWGTCCDIVHPFAGKWMREGLNMSEYDWIWLNMTLMTESWHVMVCTCLHLGHLRHLVFTFWMLFGLTPRWPVRPTSSTAQIQNRHSPSAEISFEWIALVPLLAPCLAQGSIWQKTCPDKVCIFFLCVSVSNILAFPDSQDMPFEFNLGQQERWVCKRRLWSLRWALCCATLPLQHGWSSYSFPSRGYARKVARRRLQLIVWWPVGRSWHLPGDGLFQRGGCVSWVHCNLHSFLWISFTALAPPRWSHCIPIARDLSWLFLP